ncbi:hypothetical protein SUDANB105_00755 [Streptomyces sp. enrichment culture]
MRRLRSKRRQSQADRPGDVTLAVRCAYRHGTEDACMARDSVLLVVAADGTAQLPEGWTYGTLGAFPAAFCPGHAVLAAR